MARDRRANLDEVIDQALEEEAQSRHSLARLFSDADATLDEAERAQVRLMDRAKWLKRLRGADDSIFMIDGILGPLLDFLTEHARASENPELMLRGRPRRTKGVSRYGDEIEALRALFASRYSEHSGPTERLRLRLYLGGDVQGGVRAPEPHIDPWAYAVGQALHQVEDAQLLTLTHVELPVAKRNPDGVIIGYDVTRSATAIAYEVREQTGGLPPGSQLSAGPGLSAALLIAEELGLLRGVEEALQADVGRLVGKRTSRARKEFRRLLQLVELDVPPHRVIPTAEAMESRDAPSAHDLDQAAARRDARVDVECCAGVVVVGGLRQPCRDLWVTGPESRHPSASFPLCDVCDRPVSARARAASSGG